ncbi:MAG: alpha/beta fold hydrolase [Rhizobiales bacterium]|nr:alpha/beta fold hydrolase [Hyphomicrobiales bacterium]
MRVQTAATLFLLCLIVVAVGLFYLGSQATKRLDATVIAPPADLPVREITLVDANQRGVKGWAIDVHPNRGAVLLLHGIRSDRRSLVERARFLSRAGYAVLMIDLAAHGESDGEKITFGYQEADSVVAATTYARQAWPDKKLAVIGQSLGGAAAIFAAQRAKADAYVLEAVYSTLREALENRLAIRLDRAGHYMAPLLLWQVSWRLGFEPDALSPSGKIQQLEAPVLIVTGENDRRTTIANAKTLFANAREPKTFWTVPGARHQDFHLFDPAEYEQRILTFLSFNLK